MTDTAVAATIATNTPFSPGPTIPPGKFVADGFDSPVGTATERASNKIWPGNWIAALGYHMRYGLDIPAYETGTTLILTDSDTTAHQPIFAPASGTVTFAGKVTGGIGQGNIIIIRHDPLAITGQVVYTRFSNIEGLLVKPGDRVTRGQQIADIGPDIARSPYYFLRFEISPTDILFRSPGSWYGRDLSALEANFVDPQQFILASRPHLQAPGEKST